MTATADGFFADRQNWYWSNLNSLAGAFFARGLPVLGVRQVVVSPGSRSTPLTLAVSASPELQVHTVVDERSAGFFALGLAKASNEPVALICTSGSALAHYGPAVVEANEAGIPLVLLTADRPPSLRYSRAGQTVDQLKFFSDRVRFFAEIAVPELSRSWFYRQGTVLSDTIRAAVSTMPGPVHLNFPFDEPLAPSLDSRVKLDWNPMDFWKADTSVPAQGCILAGWAQPQDVEAYCENVLDLARSLSWPIWADASSPLRHYPDPDGWVITHYERVARDPVLANELCPQGVVLIGEPPTSKVCRLWLEKEQPFAWLIDSRLPSGNVMGLRQKRLQWDGAQALSELLKGNDVQNTYISRWRALELKWRQRQREFLESVEELHEGGVSWLLGSQLPAGTPVFIASSLAIRDAEWFWPKNDRGYIVQTNRGANGIDGLIASALAMATVHCRPSVLLIGDLAFLHDAGSLVVGRQLQSHLTIVVVQNQGGGIFEHLPVSKLGSMFEQQFATPQEFSIERMAQAFGWDWECVGEPSTLAARLSALPEKGLRILEVRTDRKNEKVWRQHYLREIAIES